MSLFAGLTLQISVLTFFSFSRLPSYSNWAGGGVGTPCVGSSDPALCSLCMIAILPLHHSFLDAGVVTQNCILQPYILLDTFWVLVKCLLDYKGTDTEKVALWERRWDSVALTQYCMMIPNGLCHRTQDVILIRHGLLSKSSLKLHKLYSEWPQLS